MTIKEPERDNRWPTVVILTVGILCMTAICIVSMVTGKGW